MSIAAVYTSAGAAYTDEVIAELGAVASGSFSVSFAPPAETEEFSAAEAPSRWRSLSSSLLLGVSA